MCRARNAARHRHYRCTHLPPLNQRLLLTAVYVRVYEYGHAATYTSHRGSLSDSAVFIARRYYCPEIATTITIIILRSRTMTRCYQPSTSSVRALQYIIRVGSYGHPCRKTPCIQPLRLRHQPLSHPPFTHWQMVAFNCQFSPLKSQATPSSVSREQFIS